MEQSLKSAQESANKPEPPVDFEPAIPARNLDELRDLSGRIVAASLRVANLAHETTRARLRELLRAMNSYYSNSIEGQSTHPRNIERALHADFSAKPNVAKLQRIALAHIDAEKELEAQVAGGLNPFSQKAVLSAHAAMYGRLLPEDRVSPDGVVLVPGQIRTTDVVVGSHMPPPHGSVERLLQRYEHVYTTLRGREDQLIKVAAAHHRLAWIHPFVDGNGRASRLVTHSAMLSLTGGLWSVSRGLARKRENYYARLADADSPRRGDYDGRGSLSGEGLERWVKFFLDVCEDQATFMARMMNLDDMRRRIEALVTFRRIKPQAIIPLHHLFAAGPATRGEFKQMTGLGDRASQAVLASLLREGLVESTSRLGPVHFGLPLDALQFLLPELYPEAATQA
jgi:Fic family protein